MSSPTQAGTRLLCCHADTPGTGRLLTVALSGDGVAVRERPQTGEAPSIKGLHAWRLPELDPPPHGLRRWTRHLLPWRSLWLLGRALALRPSDQITGL